MGAAGGGIRHRRAGGLQGQQRRTFPAGLALEEGAENAQAPPSLGYYAMGDEELEEEDGDGEILGALLTHLRFVLPFLLALAFSLALAPTAATTTTGRPAFAPLASNGFALLLSSSFGSHWLVWAFLSAMLGRESGEHLAGFRHLGADVTLRIRLAGEFPSALGFACTWLLLSE
jgi:hypothetical protein